tara:strand:- start:238 stop:1560 length:1323 start_codon:yes stop_codon:yes gene_type:complete
MRTLNRPMFRYGGPIKEGVMNGIRESKRNGGPMVKQAALVGNPVYPQTDGREHHKFNIFGLGTKGSNVAKVGTGGQTSGIITQALKNFYNKVRPTYKTQPGVVTGGSAGTKQKYVDQIMPKVPFSSKVKAFAKENPFTTYGGAYVASPAIVGAATSFPYKKAGLQALDIAVPDFIFDQDKYFEEKNKVSKKIDNKVKKTPEQVEADKVAAALKAEQATVAKAEFAEKEKAKRLANYRKIMDIEGMQKDAAYDSLIAASQAIQATPDFKGGIKDGSLINKMIQGASKAYDKPKDTKNAINTLILKSQMAADTPSTALKDLIALGIDTPEKQEMYLRTKMGLPVNLGAAKAVATKSGAIGDAITIQAAQSMYGDDYKGVIMDKDTFTKRFEVATDKGAGRPNEIITGLIADEARTNEYPPGKYSVGDVVVTIDEEYNVKIER